jgi:hypothetical protein
MQRARACSFAALAFLFQRKQINRSLPVYNEEVTLRQQSLFI